MPGIFSCPPPTHSQLLLWRGGGLAPQVLPAKPPVVGRTPGARNGGELETTNSRAGSQGGVLGKAGFGCPGLRGAAIVSIRTPDFPSPCLAEVANEISSLCWRPGVLWPGPHHSRHPGPKNKGGRGQAPRPRAGRSSPAPQFLAIDDSTLTFPSGLRLKLREPASSLPGPPCLHADPCPRRLLAPRVQPAGQTEPWAGP